MSGLNFCDDMSIERGARWPAYRAAKLLDNSEKELVSVKCEEICLLENLEQNTNTSSTAGLHHSLLLIVNIREVSYLSRLLVLKSKVEFYI